MEGVGLRHLDAGWVRPVQPHLQRVLTVGQPIFGLFGRERRVMVGRGTVVQGQQAGLGDEDFRPAVLEQQKGLIPLLHRFRIGTQTDLTQVAADGVDLGLEQVGDHPHALAAAQSLGSGARGRRDRECPDRSRRLGGAGRTGGRGGTGDAGGGCFLA